MLESSAAYLIGLHLARSNPAGDCMSWHLPSTSISLECQSKHYPLGPQGILRHTHIYSQHHSHDVSISLSNYAYLIEALCMCVHVFVGKGEGGVERGYEKILCWSSFWFGDGPG